METSKHIIELTYTVKDALKHLNSFEDSEVLTLFVVDQGDKLVGAVTDGDIRRALIEDVVVQDNISKVMYQKFRYFEEGDLNLEKFNKFKSQGLKLIPMVKSDMTLVKLIDISKKSSLLPVDALIMAGGKGTRLMPLTKDCPKPLLKVGEKPIIEHNVDRLSRFGVVNLHISLKYLGEKIESYFGDGSSKTMNIDYLWEEEPLGTIGVASNLTTLKNDILLVMNSDLLTNIDFEDMYKEFISSDAHMMVATIPYNVNIPYAVLETKGKSVVSFKEKPTYTYYSNAGIYLIKREVLNLIPKNQHFNATDLMDCLIKEDYHLTYYPILGYWLDIGKHTDFEKAQEDIKHIKL